MDLRQSLKRSELLKTWIDIPKNKKEVPTCLSFITYLQKCLPNMSEISAQNRKLLEMDWQLETRKALNKISK
ncbi:hypothetical protein DPMN_183262 [Dreissena polymorpha]|uniref:Uncharacterized protein n=1 Tax=Dreissena polymorpha TaxID=45954 RepID=A0A9D4DIQ6_DREPO|nr:hypothetical protein DPMN_183262 [Dreissena polymorpha]